MQFDKPEMCLVSIINEKHVSWEFCMSILKDVFHKNYPAVCAIEGDAREVLEHLSTLIEARPKDSELVGEIKSAKEKYISSWLGKLQKDVVQNW